MSAIPNMKFSYVFVIISIGNHLPATFFEFFFHSVSLFGPYGQNNLMIVLILLVLSLATSPSNSCQAYPKVTFIELRRIVNYSNSRGSDCLNRASERTDPVMPFSNLRRETFATQRKELHSFRCVNHVKFFRLRGGRGLAPDPEDDSEVAPDWIIPHEEPRPQGVGHAADDSSQISADNTDSYQSQSSEEVVMKVNLA